MPRSPRRPFGLAPWLACLAAATLVAAPAARADIAETLDAAPLGAQVVIAVPSVSGLGEASALLNDELGLGNPMMADVVGTLRTLGGMQEGLDADGPMLLVIPTVMALAQGGNEPAVLMMAPVSDYAAFVGNFGGDAAAGAVATVTMPGGRTAYAKSSGGFAVISPLRPLVQHYRPGGAGQAILDKVGAAGAEAMADSAISLFIDMETVAPLLGPMIDVGLMTAAMQMEQQAAGNPQAAQAAQMMQAFGNAVKSVMNGTRGIAVSMDAAADGMAFELTTQMIDGSTLSKALPGGAAGRVQAAMAKLPDEPFLLAGAYDFDAINMAYLIESLVAALPADGPGAAETRKLYEDTLPLVKQLNEAAFAWYAPEEGAAADASSLFRTVTFTGSDAPAEARGTIGAYIRSMDGLEMPAGQGFDGEAWTIGYQTSYDAGAMNIEGSTVDTYSVKTIYPPEMLQQMGPAAGMLDAFGAYSGFIAETPVGLVATTTPDTGLLRDAIAAAQGGAGLGGSLGPALAHVPESPVMITVVSVQGLTDMALAAGLPLAVEGELSAITAGFGVRDNAGDFVLHVPFDSAAFLGQMAQQAVAMMFGGGFAPQGGGGDGPAY